jgi:plastocyanin
MSQQPLSEEIRFRVPLPITIPVVALLLIGGITVGMSRILLSVPKEVAVIVAVAVAANVLIAAAFIANRPDTARNAWAELLIVFLYPILIGFVLTQLNLGGEEAHAVAEEAGAQATAEDAAGGSGLNISAVDLQFSSDEISLPAGEESQLAFANEDAASIQHNVAIYEEEGGADLFVGEVIPGGQSVTYDVPALDKGEFYFQCDVHPGMNGTVTVK